VRPHRSTAGFRFKRSTYQKSAARPGPAQAQSGYAGNPAAGHAAQAASRLRRKPCRRPCGAGCNPVRPETLPQAIRRRLQSGYAGNLAAGHEAQAQSGYAGNPAAGHAAQAQSGYARNPASRRPCGAGAIRLRRKPRHRPSGAGAIRLRRKPRHRSSGAGCFSTRRQSRPTALAWIRRPSGRRRNGGFARRPPLLVGGLRPGGRAPQEDRGHRSTSCEGRREGYRTPRRGYRQFARVRLRQ